MNFIYCTRPCRPFLSISPREKGLLSQQQTDTWYFRCDILGSIILSKDRYLHCTDLGQRCVHSWCNTRLIFNMLLFPQETFPHFNCSFSKTFRLIVSLYFFFNVFVATVNSYFYKSERAVCVLVMTRDRVASTCFVYFTCSGLSEQWNDKTIIIYLSCLSPLVGW